MTPPEHRSHAVRIVRDLVEIAAILAAGVWAFYTFAYENRIKPSFANPELNFVVTMQKLGERGGLIGVRLHTEIHNVGTVQASIVGLSYWVLGKRVEALRGARAPVLSAGGAVLKAFYAESPGTPVFGLAYLTRMADPASSSRTDLEPGADLARDTVFFVPAARFDYLEAHLSARFTKEKSPVPSTMIFGKDGLPKFNVPSNRSDVDENSAIPSQLDLNGPQSPGERRGRRRVLPKRRAMTKSAYFVLAFLCAAAPATAQQRTVVTDETQLPRFAYPMAASPSKLLTSDDATFGPFLQAVARDVNRTLATYDIADKATLSDYLMTRLDAQLLTGDYAGARATVAQLRDAQSKAARKLLAGRLQLAYIAASARQRRAEASARRSRRPIVRRSMRCRGAWSPIR